MTPLASSNLDGCDYADDTRELTIAFKSGSVYVYSGVPREVYEGLTGAISPGRYFQSSIKDAYSYRRET